MKKTLASLLFMAGLHGQVLAGNDPSTLAREEEKPSSARQSESDRLRRGAAVLGGAAVLAGAATLAYTYYHQPDEESDRSETSELTSAEEASYEEDSYEEVVDEEHPYRTYTGEDPVIDLGAPFEDESSFQEPTEIEYHAKIDLHPVYNQNPRQYLLTQLRQYHTAFNQGSPAKRIHVITGTGLKRLGPPYRLYKAVETWLEEDAFRRLIQAHHSPQEGLYTVILKKKRPR